MELILILLYLAFSSAATSSVVVEDSYREIGELACSDLDMLGNTVYEYAPLDKKGELSVGCTLLPSNYEPDVNRFLGEFTVDCVNRLCRIKLQEVVHKGRVFYIAEGWLAQIDDDAFLHLLEFPEIELNTVPCEVEGVRCLSYPQDSAIPIGHPFDQV